MTAPEEREPYRPSRRDELICWLIDAVLLLASRRMRQIVRVGVKTELIRAMTPPRLPAPSLNDRLVRREWE